MAHRIGIIGGGNMGLAIVRGGIEAGVFKPHEIIVAEIDRTRQDRLTDLGCAVTDQPKRVIMSPQIVLAVKPQSFADVAAAIAPLPEERVVISIMAGLTSTALRAALGERARIVRAMPNVACQIGAGMTAIARGEGSREGDEQMALMIFSALGRTVMVEEGMMHAATAVSGSGPAYVFLLAEAMEQAALQLGFDNPVARLLVLQTIKGAADLMLAGGSHDPQQLRASVTSPGGTTAAAIHVFQTQRFVPIVMEALTAARDRGVELDRLRNPAGQI